MSTNDARQIEEVLTKYSRSWEAMDWDGLKNIWDRDYPHILYIPEERPQPVSGWNGIEQYFENAAQSVVSVHAMQLSGITIDVFEDTAYAFCDFYFEADIKRMPETFKTNGRDTFILRRKKEDWKVIHYHESRPHSG